MYLESGRALVQGGLILVSVAIAYWVNLTIGLVLAALLGLIILQSAFTELSIPKGQQAQARWLD